MCEFSNQQRRWHAHSLEGGEEPLVAGMRGPGIYGFRVTVKVEPAEDACRSISVSVILRHTPPPI